MFTVIAVPVLVIAGPVAAGSGIMYFSNIEPDSSWAMFKIAVPVTLICAAFIYFNWKVAREVLDAVLHIVR